MQTPPCADTSDTLPKQSKETEIDFDKLRFIRVFTPLHVPKALIEQVRERDYEVEDWYRYQETICVHKTKDGTVLNPMSMLYVIADEGNKVVGMFWCEVSVLEKALIVQTFSMDKKYWFRGKAVQLLAKKAKEIAKECKLKTILWMTAYPKHSLRYGFKRDKQTLMSWTQEDDIKEEEENGKIIIRERETHRGCPSDGSEPTECPAADVTRTGT